MADNFDLSLIDGLGPDDLLGLDFDGLELEPSPLAPPRGRQRRRLSKPIERAGDVALEWLAEAEKRLGVGRNGLAPVPFDAAKLRPGESTIVRCMPQIPIGPPFRLQVGPEPVEVNDLQIGNCSLFVAPGSIAAERFRTGEQGAAPLGLMLLDGPPCYPGLFCSIYVHNRGSVDVLLEATLWGVLGGQRRNEDARLLAMVRELVQEAIGGPPKGKRCPVCNWYGSHASACPELTPPTLEQELERARELLRARGELAPAPLLGPPVPAELELERKRRNADRDATRAYLEANPPAPAPTAQPEPEWWECQWSTACDES